MLVRNHTGLIPIALSTGTADVVSPTAGTETTFSLGNLPADIGGNLAAYLVALQIMVKGRFTQAGGSGSRVYSDNFVRALIASLEIRGAYFGSPIQSSQVLGAYLPLIEHIGCGFSSQYPARPSFAAANGNYDFGVRITVPLCSRNTKPHHLSQLALLYRTGQLVISWAAASVISGISTGSSISGMDVRVNALVLPDSEIRLGPAHEWRDYKVEYSSATEVTFRDFGTGTGYAGVEPESGIMSALLLTSKNGLGGAFTAENVTAIGWPDRGIPRIADPAALLAQWYAAAPRGRVIGSNEDRGTSGSLSDLSGPPHAIGAEYDDAERDVAEADLLCYPLVLGGSECELSKLQTWSGPARLNLELSSGSGTHHLLTEQVKAWTPEQAESIARAIVESGLARRVLGAASAYDWDTKMLRKQPPGAASDDAATEAVRTASAKKERYLPLKLVPVGGTL